MSSVLAGSPVLPRCQTRDHGASGGEAYVRPWARQARDALVSAPLASCQIVPIDADPIGAVGSAPAGRVQLLGDAINFRQLRLPFRSEVKPSEFLRPLDASLSKWMLCPFSSLERHWTLQTDALKNNRRPSECRSPVVCSMHLPRACLESLAASGNTRRQHRLTFVVLLGADVRRINSRTNTEAF